jgi:hypothetical protein
MDCEVHFILWDSKIEPTYLLLLLEIRTITNDSSSAFFWAENLEFTLRSTDFAILKYMNLYMHHHIIINITFMNMRFIILVS